MNPVRTQVNHTLSLVNRPSVLRNIELYRATYDLTDLFSRYGADLVLTGHDHYREQTVFKGVEYVIVDVLEEKTDNAGYAVVNVGRDIEVGFVSL